MEIQIYRCTYCGYEIVKEELDKIKNAKPGERIISKAFDHFNEKHTVAMSLSDWLPEEIN